MITAGLAYWLTFVIVVCIAAPLIVYLWHK